MPTATPPAELCFSARATIQASAAKGPPRLEILAYGGRAMNVTGYGAVLVVVKGVESIASLPILADHRNELDSIVGMGSPSMKDNRITISGTIASDGEAGARVLKLHKGGFGFSASIGLEPLERKYVEPGQVVMANGQKITAPTSGLTLITKSRLYEVSLVAIGADKDASVTISAKGRTMVKAAILEGDVQLEGNDDVQAMRQQAAELAAEQSRINYIEANMSTPILEPLKATAIANGWEKKMVDERVTAAAKTLDRARSPGIHSIDREANADIITASLCRTIGVSEKFIGAQFGERITNESMSAANRGAGLQSCMSAIVRAAGLSMPSGRFDNEHIRTAWRASRSLQASFSTISLPGIFSDLANKSLKAEWEQMAVCWPMISTRAAPRDFKTFTSYRIALKGRYEQLAPDGRMKHVSLIEGDYENKIATYALVLGISRQDMINDDLSAIGTAPKAIANLHHGTIEEMVFTTLLGAGSFFHADNKNLLTGAGGALSVAGLTLAEAKLKKMVDLNGRFILQTPQVLLTPVALDATARQIIAASDLIGAPMTPAPAANPFSGRYALASSPYLDTDSPISGGSATAYYVIGSGGKPIEVAFLNGKDMPTIETEDAEFDQLGWNARSYFDAGIALSEPSSTIKVNGA